MFSKWLPSTYKSRKKKIDTTQAYDEIWVEIPLVLGTDTIQQIVETRIDLEESAQKIRDISVEIKQLQKEMLLEQIIISGWLVHHIFYVGDDHTIHHKLQETPFRFNMEFVNAKPEYDLMVSATLGYMDYQLKSERWLEIRNGVEFFIQVTEIRDGLMPVGGEKKYRILNLLHDQEKKVISKYHFEFEEQVQEIENINGEFILKEINVLKDQVFIEGDISLEIYYTGQNNRSLFLREEVPVEVAIDVPGLVDGNHLLTHGKGQISFIEPKIVDQKHLALDIGVNVNVRIGEVKNSRVVVNKGKDRVVLSEVLGETNEPYFIESVFEIPQGIPNIYQIKEIKNNILNYKGTIVKDNVLVEGTLKQEVFYIGNDFTEYSFEREMNFDYYIPFLDAEVDHLGEVIVEVSYCKGEIRDKREILERLILKNNVYLTQQVQVEVLIKDRNRQL